MNPLRKASKKLLEKHVYLVGTNHKAGSQLLRNTMHWMFDTLGATDSCQFGSSSRPITSKPGFNEDCTLHPTPIRFYNSISGKDILNLRKEAAFTGGMRGVIIIRDPLEMVVSSFCYHHRGAGAGLGLAPAKIMEMGPEEGVPAMVPYMLPVVRKMTSAYEVANPVRFEKFTNNSKDFDDTMREILVFLFGNEITEKQKQQVLDAAAVEDQNRGLEGFSEDPALNRGFNHTNDEEDMAAARRALHLIPEDLLAELQTHRTVLGYA
ncbi:Copia protein [Durusdinium trenchii]|uniref:Copia protein n=1 Tax=Durusdinium trenchii TaxID=1381693 RepID=A0ABP0JSX0_9DINO